MKSATAPRPGARDSNKMSVITILSYVLDWIILIAVGVTGVILGDITPNMRPFSLQDPNISYVLPALPPPCVHDSPAPQTPGWPFPFSLRIDTDCSRPT